MAQRKPLILSMQDALKKGDELIMTRKFHRAYALFSQLHLQAQNPIVQLYCRAKMLFCQYQKRTLSWGKIITRAQEYINQLDAVIATDAASAWFYEALKEDMRRLILALDTREKKIAYLRASAHEAVERCGDDIFCEFTQMMELDVGHPTYEADYLKGLYNELKVAKVKGDIYARLSETIGDAYRGCADAEVNKEEKLRYARLALHYYEIARTGWSSMNSFNGIVLYSVSLHVWQEIYSCVEHDEKERKQVLASMSSVMNGFEKVQVQLLKAKDEYSDVIKDMQDHYEWYQAKIRCEMTKRTRQSDENLMPPPPKRPRLERGLFSASVSVNKPDDMQASPSLKINKTSD